MLDDLGFYLRSGGKTVIKWVALPLLGFTLIIAIMFAITFTTAQSKMQNQPNPLNPSQMSASNKMYVDSFLDALRCVKDETDTSCDINSKKSNFIKNFTSSVLLLNGKSYPTDSKEKISETIRTTDLKDIDYASVMTKSPDNSSSFDYTDEKHQITIQIIVSSSGEINLKSMEVKDK